MKLGIVGSGKIVQEFLPWLAQSPVVEVAALCSTAVCPYRAHYRRVP